MGQGPAIAPRSARIAAAAAVLCLAFTPAARTATREELLALGQQVADRLAVVQPVDRTWQCAPYLVGSLLLWDQLVRDGSIPPPELWERVDAATAEGNGEIRHGDAAAFAQAAMELYRQLPPDDPGRSAKLAVTDAALVFADVALHRQATDGDPLFPWWVAQGYGCRYWQDDLFMVVPFLALRGSSSTGLPGDVTALDLAYEWIEAYAFDHRKGMDGAADGPVPALPERRREGWDLADPASGRLLWDPDASLWWHDEGDLETVQYWSRGNGWVAAGLARAQLYLDRPYSGGRFEQVLDRLQLRQMLSNMAVRAARQRTVFGVWGSGLLGASAEPELESSGSALLLFALAQGVNQGWLDEELFAPVVAKGVHALSLVVDPDGDVHQIQPPATGASPGPYLASDDPSANLAYGSGAVLMALAEAAGMSAELLQRLEELEAAEIARDRFTEAGDQLEISLEELDAFGVAASGAWALGAICDQGPLGVTLASGTLRVEGSCAGDVTLFLQGDQQSTDLPFGSCMVPVVANTPGLGSTHWSSDVVLHNPGALAQSVRLTMRAQGSEPVSVAFEVSAHASLALDDVMETAFGAQGKGTLQVVSADPLLVSSRTYTESADGSFGQSIPAVERWQALLSGEEVRLLMLGRDEGRRTNLGCASFAGLDVAVSFAVFTPAGDPLGEVVAVVPAHGVWQRTDALAELLPAGGDAHAVVRVLTAGAAVVPYASVVDARTGDPSFVLAAEPVAAATVPEPAVPAVLYVPAVAHNDGLNGTQWRTDLEVHNPGPGAASFVVELLVSREDNSAPLSLSFAALPAGASLRVEDAVLALFGVDDTGALRIRPTLGSLMVASRTYNRTEAGTLGQYIPGLSSAAAIHHGETALLTPLAHSADPNAGSRTNVGFVNLRPAPVTLRIELLTAEAALLATRVVRLAPFEHRQLNNVFAGCPETTLEAASAEVSTSTAGGAVLVYASVVDNRSGDPVLVSGRRVPGEDGSP